MLLTSSIRKTGGSTYIKLSPAFVEYCGIDKYLALCKKEGIEAECKIEDKTKNILLVTLPKW